MKRVGRQLLAVGVATSSVALAAPSAFAVADARPTL